MVARRAATLVLAAALATGLAACGGEDDDGGRAVELEDVESDASSSGSSSADDEDAAADDEAADDDAAADEEATDAPADDAIEGAFSEGCGEFAQVFGALGGAIGGAFDADAAAEFESFVDDAPEEVQDDLETMAGAYQELAALFEEAGFDPEDPSSFDPSNPEAIGVLSEAGELFSTPEFIEATTAVNDFIASNCEG